MSFTRKLTNFMKSGMSDLCRRECTRPISKHLKSSLSTTKQSSRLYSCFHHHNSRSFKRCVTSTKFNISACLQNRIIHTEGDKELIHFLQEEIAYEQENTIEAPQFRDFELYVDETRVSLTKQFKDESIEVHFDVNENVNVDEGLNQDDEMNINEAIKQPDIVSYPQFNVKITKPSGRTLQFNCTCNNIGEDIEGEESSAENPEEQFDLFRFDTLKIYEEGQNVEDTYEAETENLDGELYSNLMTTLLERGITGNFVNDLLELSTALEHQKYLQFLNDLKKFAAE